MADPGRPRGGGRGAALMAMLKRPGDTPAEKQTPTSPPAQPTRPPPDKAPVLSPPGTPATTMTQPSAPVPTRPRGRASLIDIVQSSAPSASRLASPMTPPSTPAPAAGRAGLLAALGAAARPGQPATPRVGIGRASILPGTGQRSAVAATPGAGEPHILSTQEKMAAEAAAIPPQPGLLPMGRPMLSGDGQGVTGSLAAMTLESKSATSGSSGPISRMGTDGTPINIMSNYINISLVPGKGIYRYEVKYSPETDSPRIRNALLNQHLAMLGNTKTFDGMTLYIPQQLPQDRTTVTSVRQDGTEIQLTIIFQRQQKPMDSVQFFNVLLKKILNMLKMVRINRNFFNPRCAHRIDQHRMELWPGYITAIEEMEGGLKLNIDASHRLMRTDTIRDFIKDIYSNTRGGNFHEAVLKELMGMTVLTRYNNQTYRVDDIHWDKDPSFQFDYKGNMISIAEYFQTHWNLPVQDMKQPLILHRAKKKLTQGGTVEEEVLLVPEFCYLTGMTDAVRSNFRIMKDLAQVTQVQPEARRNVIRKFIEDVNNTPAAKELLENWGLKLENDIVGLQGRVLPAETIFLGNDKKFQVTEKADWSSAVTRSAMLRTPHMKSWCIVYVQRDERIICEFAKMLKNVSQVMAMNVGDPLKICLRNDSAASYVTEIRKAINPNLEMVVAVCPTNRNDRYAAIKKLCCVESPVRSQVIISKTISQDNKLKSVTEKIALQMNCKLGGALWALKVPFGDIMIIGIDVYHAPAGSGQKGSVAGFVASLDKPLTQWFSKTCFQGPNQEIIDLLKMCLINALGAYKKKRGEYPARIIVYRDGVGDGQLDNVARYEVEQLKNTFPLVEKNYAPKLSFIVVQKRINTRIMALKRDNKLENPPPGTIVDSCVTRRNFFDFFLVPQTARQGTVTPTHYIVLIDEYGHKIDHLQRLSYKLCHLYYNWPGTIRVPAPCQYAHKLANLVGQSVQSEPNDCLSETLYYL